MDISTETFRSQTPEFRSYLFVLISQSVYHNNFWGH